MTVKKIFFRNYNRIVSFRMFWDRERGSIVNELEIRFLRNFQRDISPLCLDSNEFLSLKFLRRVCLLCWRKSACLSVLINRAMRFIDETGN